MRLLTNFSIALVFLLTLLASPAMAVPACISSHPAICYAQPFTTNACGSFSGVDPAHGLKCWSDYLNNYLPGDKLIISGPGDYTVGMFITNAASGTSSSYQLITGQGNPRFNITTGNGRGMEWQYGLSYLDVEGIEFTNGDMLNANCIFQETDPSHTVFGHHIIFKHNITDHCGQEGVNWQGLDYLTIQYNTCHDIGTNSNNESPSCYHIYQPLNYDTLPGVHILIDSNISYNVFKGQGSPISDGMNHEIDDADGTQGSWCTNWPSNCPYTGTIQISNNGGHDNDGDCVHDFSSIHATLKIFQNTCYKNDQSQASGSVYGPISITDSSNVSSYNNIIIPRTSAYFAHNLSTATNVTIDYNNYFGAAGNVTQASSSGVTIGTHSVTGNPLLNFAAANNFTPSPGSAAFGIGDPTHSTMFDIFGNLRSGFISNCSGAKVDAGAVEIN